MSYLVWNLYKIVTAFPVWKILHGFENERPDIAEVVESFSAKRKDKLQGS